MERTTDLKELKSGEVGFTWGEVIQILKVGEYAIVEYHPWKYKGGVSTGQVNTGKAEFSCYVNKESTSCSCDSLDAALAHCIAYKHEGANTRASDYFMRMLQGVTK